MATNLAQNESFWKGIAAGFFAGMGMAAVLRYMPLQKIFTSEAAVESKPYQATTLMQAPLQVPVSYRPAPAGFHSLRDHPESAGDPRNLASARTGISAGFVRRGAPGGKEAAEVLEVPGQQLDHIDLSQPQRRFRRSFEMGSAG